MKFNTRVSKKKNKNKNKNDIEMWKNNTLQPFLYNIIPTDPVQDHILND